MTIFRFVYKLTRNLTNGVCQRDQLTLNVCGKQIMLFKRVAIYRSGHNRNKSVRDALRILLFLYHNLVKITMRFGSKWVGACNFIQVRVLKITNF